ncbi:MAG TPA: hypothetical protein VMG31_12160 [Verrucomicrobiae bacterium]|nr:hypothetical protein [Verrucomicrobiae bacterium]
MTSRVSYAPQDFQKMCQQAERDHESKKLAVLLERVKKQIAARTGSERGMDAPKPPVAVISGGSHPLRPPSRTAPFDR